MDNLSIYSNENYTKDNIDIIYTPSSGVLNYEYIITKNNYPYKTVSINDNRISKIILNETGSYQIKIKENYIDSTKEITSGIYNIDKEAPILEVGKTSLKVKQGSTIDIMGGVKAIDNIDGDITSYVITNEKELNLNKIGNHKLKYTVSDSSGNEISKIVNINIIKNDSFQLLLTQSFILIALLIILIYTIKYNRSLNIEKRIAPYTVKTIKDHSKSLFGNIFTFIDKIIKKISKFLEKSVFLNKIGKRYTKYVNTFGKEKDTAITIISQKIIMSFIFLVIAMISKTIRLEVLSIYEMIVPLIIGYYFLDIVYAYRYKIYRKKLENDFLQAIIVMNNAFKSGRSIVQAVELVSTELTGPIAEEFKKIALEISFGLDIEVAFKRLANRIKLEEATYLTAALSITNKTGGNIIRVFDSIEKTLFNRKKLKLELKSLTSSSRIIMYVLIFIPLIFTFVISLISSTYFLPLFSSPIGLILILIMIIIYITYIIVVKKIMNVRM